MIKNLLSERESELPEIEMENLLKILNEDKHIISLGPGQPDFGPPKHVIKAACDALKRGEIRYAPAQGRRELLEAVSKKLKKENKINVSPEQVVITSGSNEAILLALMATVDPGEQVLVHDPCFLDFIPAIEVLSGQAISIPTYQENNFQLTAEMIKEQIKDPKRIRVLILNTPCNPTGAVYPKKTLEEIAKVAREYNLLIISDEAYEKFIY
jgi:aspartate/methionine/tyrosine aminotransferase